MSKITLEQWRVLHAVVDLGGFTQAAEALHKSQSSISYSVNKLQQQLGFSLLVMEGRKAILTPRGRILLERSRQLIEQEEVLDSLSSHLEADWGSRLNIQLDNNIPRSLIYRVIARFQYLYPGVSVYFNGESFRAFESSLLGDSNLLSNSVSEADALNRDVKSATNLRLTSVSKVMGDVPLLEFEWVLAVSSQHVLASSVIAAQDELIELHNIKLQDNAQNANSADSITTLVDMVRAGLGCAYLPLCEAQTWLNYGELTRVSNDRYGSFSQPLFAYVESDQAVFNVVESFLSLLKQMYK